MKQFDCPMKMFDHQVLWKYEHIVIWSKISDMRLDLNLDIY